MEANFNELDLAISQIDTLKNNLNKIEKAHLSFKLSGTPFEFNDDARFLFKLAINFELVGLQVLYREADNIENNTLKNIYLILHLAGRVFDKYLEYFPIESLLELDNQIHFSLHATLCYCSSMNPQNAIPVFKKLAKRISLDDFIIFGLEEIEAKFQYMLFYFLGRDVKRARELAKEIINLCSETCKSDFKAVYDFYILSISKAILSLSSYLLYGNNEKLIYHDFFEPINSTFDILLYSGDSLYLYIIQALNAVANQMIESSVWKNLSLDNKYIKYLTIRKKIIELWGSQIDAINSGFLDDNENFILSLPTSAGKTLLAEFKVIDFFSKNDDGKKVIYLVPTKALGQQIFKTMKNGISIVGKTSGLLMNISEEVDINLFNKSDFVVITPEKLELTIRNKPEIANEIGLVIVDEFHTIGEGERGLKLEFLLYRIKLNPDIKLFILSAVIPNTDKIAEWLNGRQLLQNRRLIKLYKGYSIKNSQTITLSGLGTINLPMRTDTNQVVDIAKAFRKMGPVLVIVDTKEQAEKKAKSFLNMQKKEKENTEINQMRVDLSEQFAELYPNGHQIIEMIKYGVSYHHGDLENEARILIEKAMRENIIDVIFATTTLAEGIDFPVETVILSSLYQSGKQIKKSLLNNIAGRAGRACFQNEGFAIFICPEHWTNEDAKNFWWLPNEPLKSVLVDYSKILFDFDNELYYKRFNKKLGKHERIINKPKFEWTKDIYYTFLSYIWAYINEGILLPEEDSVNEMLNEMFLGSTQIAEEEKQCLSKWVCKKSIELSNITMPKKVQMLLVSTGFSYHSCLIIYEAIEKYFSENFIFDLDNEFLEWFIELSKKIKEIKVKKKFIKVDKLKILKEWLFTDETNIEQFFIDFTTTEINDYIASRLKFALPWLANAIVKVISYQYSESMNFSYEYLPEFIRFGVTEPITAILMSIGFDKVTAKSLSEQYPYVFNNKKSVDSMWVMEWVCEKDFKKLIFFDDKNLAIRQKLINNLIDFEQISY